MADPVDPRDLADSGRNRRRSRPSSARYRQSLVDRDYPGQLIGLLVRLNELGVAGGFENTDAARRVVPGDGPKLGDLDPSTGEFVVNRRLLSAQLAPRDRLTPPCLPLVEAIVELYLERTGADAAATHKQINVLYAAAASYHVAEIKRRGLEAAEKGLRTPSLADVQRRDREIAQLREALDRRDVDLDRARDQVSALSVEIDQHISQLASMGGEITRLHTQLVEQQLETAELHRQVAEQQAELELARADQDQHATRTLSCSDRMSSCAWRTRSCPRAMTSCTSTSCVCARRTTSSMPAYATRNATRTALANTAMSGNLPPRTTPRPCDHARTLAGAHATARGGPQHATAAVPGAGRETGCFTDATRPGTCESCWSVVPRRRWLASCG